MALKPDERDIVERAWKLIEDDEQVTTAFELLADEIERLRAALQELRGIARHNSILHPSSVMDFIDRALEPTRTDDE